MLLALTLACADTRIPLGKLDEDVRLVLDTAGTEVEGDTAAVEDTATVDDTAGDTDGVDTGGDTAEVDLCAERWGTVYADPTFDGYEGAGPAGSARTDTWGLVGDGAVCALSCDAPGYELYLFHTSMGRAEALPVNLAGGGWSIIASGTIPSGGVACTAVTSAGAWTMTIGGTR